MPIEITKEQYAAILRAVMISGAVYDSLVEKMSDNEESKRCAALASEMEGLEEFLLDLASDFDMPEIAEEDEGITRPSVNYASSVIEDLEAYDDLAMLAGLAEELAKKKTLEEISASDDIDLSEEEIASLMTKYASLYWNEFVMNGLGRVRVDESEDFEGEDACGHCEDCADCGVCSADGTASEENKDECEGEIAKFDSDNSEETEEGGKCECADECTDDCPCSCHKE